VLFNAYNQKELKLILLRNENDIIIISMMHKHDERAIYTKGDI